MARITFEMIPLRKIDCVSCFKCSLEVAKEYGKSATVKDGELEA
jgi:hypothetical protein